MHRQARGALGGAVCHADRLEPGAAQRAQRELDHLARAHEQRALLGERLEDLRREVHRHARHRHRPLRDPRLAAHALGGGERVLQHCEVGLEAIVTQELRALQTEHE